MINQSPHVLVFFRFDTHILQQPKPVLSSNTGQKQNLYQKYQREGERKERERERGKRERGREEREREKREESQGEEKLWRKKSIKNETRDGHLISNQCSVLGYF